MAKCICKTMAHGHGDHCERTATKPDGLCEDCHNKLSREAQKLLEDEEREKPATPQVSLSSRDLRHAPAGQRRGILFFGGRQLCGRAGFQQRPSFDPCRHRPQAPCTRRWSFFREEREVADFLHGLRRRAHMFRCPKPLPCRRRTALWEWFAKSKATRWDGHSVEHGKRRRSLSRVRRAFKEPPRFQISLHLEADHSEGGWLRVFG